MAVAIRLYRAAQVQNYPVSRSNLKEWPLRYTSVRQWMCNQHDLSLQFSQYEEEPLRSGSTWASMFGTRAVAFNLRTLGSCCRSSIGMLRSFSALLLLASSHPSRSAFLSNRLCSKRVLHSPFSRALKAAQDFEVTESATRNFITNLIEDDIKENKVWYSTSLNTIAF